jgi:Fe-S cluster assembly protein SufD
MKSQGMEISATDFVAQFNKEKDSFNPGLLELKRKSIDDLKLAGFPSMKNEEWKYTNVNPILKNSFSIAGEISLKEKDIQDFLPPEENAVVLVFENGRFNSSLSHLSGLPDGIIAGDLNNNISHHSAKNYFGTIANNKSESFLSLNTAMFHHGAFIYAAKNIVCEKCIHILFISDSRKGPVVNFPRNFIYADEGSSLKITESYFSINSAGPSFNNSVSEIFTGNNAAVEFCKTEAESENDFHIDYTGAVLHRNSAFQIHTVTTGGKIVRNNLRIELRDQNGSAYLNGLYVTNGDTHVDNHSVVDHASPNCYSNELYKGVLNDKSHGIFNGKIFVRRDAQKTNAYQSNKNILLSNDASVNAKPQLEIYADDVKCSHGATTGQLDPEALFYLRSRGIGENESRAMLTSAFAQDILDRITIVSEKEKLQQLIHNALKRGNS